MSASERAPARARQLAMYSALLERCFRCYHWEFYDQTMTSLEARGHQLTSAQLIKAMRILVVVGCIKNKYQGRPGKPFPVGSHSTDLGFRVGAVT